MASTPPPPSALERRIHTPPTPLHGARYDKWEPYSPPRRSARVEGKRTQRYLSPTATSTAQDNSHPGTVTATPAKKRVLSRQISSQTLSPPSSPEDSHARGKTSDAATKRSAQTNAVTSDASTSHHNISTVEEVIDANDAAHMFPTPRKTPRKQDSASRNSSTRALHFRTQPEDIFPPSRKRRLRTTLDSPQESPSSSTVQIFTDSQDRVPEMQHSDDNPFVGPRKPIRNNGRAKSRRLNQDEAEMDEAVQNDEGLIYVFRGRKTFRRFTDGTSAEVEVEDADLHNMAGQTARIRHMAGPSAHRPITRSTLKPRLLFPSAEHRGATQEADEEALTDIEDEVAHRSARSSAKIVSFESVEPDSPVASRDEPQMTLDETPASTTASKGKAKKPSPFDSWPRQKAGASRSTSGTKRSPTEPAQATSSKRTRSTANTA
ncbi:hypothetical protein K461DRAFT_267838 [Myriangium duriaei CBS 260.36]|uniref:Uncharacterized protein n=1 Tax=Myriangium duriaei CBS 260.36 TaxID=1168546 RepID=A0A9P4J6F8_9PEZI|nr:hypothetical protein K461DRAFT_267838 [Myriangium duriaei CBS 260.36]